MQLRENHSRKAFACLVFGCLWTAVARGQLPVTVSITNSSGYVLPADFAGLSFEIGTQRAGRGGVSGYIFSATNTPMVTLFQNIGLRNLRVGGGTVDGTNAVLLTDAEIDNLFEFAQAVGNLEIIYSLQLLNGNTNTDAATAQYIWQHYESQLECFAIGNEPDWQSYSYPPYGSGSDPLITGYASYLSDWQNFAGAVTNLAPGAVFAGPDTGSDFDEGAPDGITGHWAHNGTEWTTDFAADERGSKIVPLITQHEYEANTRDSSPAPTNGPAFIDAMLSPQWDTVTNQTLYNAMAAPILAEGLPYRFTEANEVVGGVTNASGTLASALWALDFLHWWASHGCAGVNFHNKPWLLTDTIYYSDGYQVYPKAYAIKAFTLGSHGSEQGLNVVNTNNLNLTAYAIFDQTNLCVTMINREHGFGARDAAVTIQTSGYSSAGNIGAMSLAAADGNIAATNGITLGGATIAANALWSGQWANLGAWSGNQATVTVPASSAMVVKITFAPRLSVARSGNEAVITFSGALLSSTNVAGPYAPVLGASPPVYTTAFTNSRQFFKAANR